MTVLTDRIAVLLAVALAATFIYEIIRLLPHEKPGAGQIVLMAMLLIALCVAYAAAFRTSATVAVPA